MFLLCHVQALRESLPITLDMKFLALNTEMTGTGRQIVMAKPTVRRDITVTTLAIQTKTPLPTHVGTMIDTARILDVMSETIDFSACGRCTSSNETCHPTLVFQWSRRLAACAGVGSGAGQR